MKGGKLHIEIFFEVCAAKIGISGDLSALKAGIAHEFGTLEIGIGKKARLPEACRSSKRRQPEVGRPGEFGLCEVGLIQKARLTEVGAQLAEASRAEEGQAIEDGIAEVGYGGKMGPLESSLTLEICISEGGISLKAAGLKSGSARERCSFKACLLQKGAAAQVQGFSQQGMSEVHVSQKLAVPDLDLGGHDCCRLRLFSGALTVDEGQIQPGDVYVTGYGHVIVDERIAILDPDLEARGPQLREDAALLL